MDICTIIAKNYVAQARVLARSFLEHHGEGRCSVLVIDDYDGYLEPDAEPFRILTPEQIGCEQFEEMAWRYDVLELSTAVKPWLLAYLLDEGAAAITYLDPDIRIHSSLEMLDELARSHGVVLIPHNTKPLPDDGERPTQIDILLAGVYNLGYVSIGGTEETKTLLRWWRERLLNDCRVDPHKGYFVDQRWFDLAPGLVSDHAIVRDPQFNVAYWNLHSRRLERDGTGYNVDKMPLSFFHFSGFDPDKPDVLSRHQSRVTVEADTALQLICEEYAEEVIASGYQETKDWPYSYHVLPSGVKLNRRLRRLYEIASEMNEVRGSPFSEDGSSEFMSWLAAPAPGAPAGVNRLLANLYGTRTDLQEAFPDVAGSNYHDFLRWAQETGVVEEPALSLIPTETVSIATTEGTELLGSPRTEAAESTELADRDAQVTADPDAQLVRPSWGVNVVGYFRSELGVGEAARQVVRALDAGRIPLLPMHGRTIPPNRQGHAFTHLASVKAHYPVNLICMNADALDEFAGQVGREFFQSRYSIGMWFWEVAQFPRVWESAFDHIDELWLPTNHVITAVRPVSSVPITKITLPVEMAPLEAVPRAELNLPEGFLFLYSFDHHSVFERKNPLGVIEAYKRSFKPEDGAALVVKSINGSGAAEHHASLFAAADDRPDVHIIDGYLSSRRKDLMVASCDCYVSLHRAEGFGLTMAEAMYLGKPVIATGYSGNLDFMTEDNSFLVPYELVEIGPGADPYPASGQWAEPDIDEAGRLMREVFENSEQAVAKGQRAATDIRTTHSATAAAEIMSERLELLRERYDDRLVAGRRYLPVAGPLGERIRTGPPVGAPSRMGRAGKLARRLVLRTSRPFTVHQQAVDLEITESLRALETRLGEFETVTTERHASLLAELRRDDAFRELWERIGSLARSIAGLEAVAARLERAVGELPDVPQRLDDLTGSLRVIEWENRAIPYMEGKPFDDLVHPNAGLVQGYRLGVGSDDLDAYRSFEDTFRGSEEFIRDRQRSFLGVLGDRAPVLDFGCGRGEFLDLLTERGIACVGVDADAGMVKRCHEKGHRYVVHADGLDYLNTLTHASLGAIFCAQVVEHLTYEAFLRLLQLAHDKLSADGVLIVETVNPHSAAALKTFWVDPTHQHPIFPEVMLSLCRSTGFSTAFVFHPNGTGDVERDRFAQGEYAVVAGGQSLLSAGDDQLVADANGGPGRSLSGAIERQRGS